MGKQRGDDRRLGHVLTRVGGVAVLAELGVAELAGGALMRAAAGAEDPVWDVVRAMVTPHLKQATG